MPEPLPPCSGDDTECPKCRGKGAYTDYRAHGQCLHRDGGGIVGVEPNERLHRQCARCNYAWDEAVAVPAPTV